MLLLAVGVASRQAAAAVAAFAAAGSLKPKMAKSGQYMPHKIAAAAFFRMNHVGRVIALGVEGGGERQDMRGTELYAESAGLTSLDHDLAPNLWPLLPFRWRLARGLLR